MVTGLYSPDPGHWCPAPTTRRASLCQVWSRFFVWTGRGFQNVFFFFFILQFLISEVTPKWLQLSWAETPTALSKLLMVWHSSQGMVQSPDGRADWRCIFLVHAQCEHLSHDINLLHECNFSCNSHLRIHRNTVNIHYFILVRLVAGWPTWWPPALHQVAPPPSIAPSHPTCASVEPQEQNRWITIIGCYHLKKKLINHTKFSD